MWADGIQQYISNLLKNEHELTKIVFNTDHSLLVHNVKYQLENFSQRPQSKFFEKGINKWDKDHEYGNVFLKEHFDNLVIRITTIKNNQRRAPGYKKADDVADIKEINPDKDAQTIFENGFFAGVDAPP